MESHPRQCRVGDELFVEEIGPASPEFIECTDRPEACTMHYDPVCAVQLNGIQCITTPCPSTDAVTMGNACSACSNEATIGHYPGECTEHRFVICDEPPTGFDIRQMAEDAGWVCVDICPNNYDAYTTQVGAQMCILHYGTAEIASWEPCDRSSDTCECVRTYETTEGDPIDDPEFHCVPEQYAERLLFRGGQERLDEQGRASTLIA